MHEVGEFGLIRRWEREVPIDRDQVRLGIGDDAAVLAPSAGWEWLATTDMLVEAVHFDLSFITPEQLGRRALVANLSDIAAMGGRPKFALVSLALPGETDCETVDGLYRGLVAEASAWGVSLVGGDTVRSPSGLVINVVVLGQVEADRAVTRSGARPGELVAVTGDLGGSAAGLATFGQQVDAVPGPAVERARGRHLGPRPRLAEGALIAAAGASAMIDVSDGLANEVNHLARHSRVGIVVDAASVPVHASTRAVAEALGVDPLQWALNGGEDYELVFCAAPAVVGALARRVPQVTGVAVTVVGHVESGAGCYLDTGTERRPLPPSAYDHFRHGS